MEINNELVNRMEKEIKEICFFKSDAYFDDQFLVINDYEEALFWAFKKDDYQFKNGETWSELKEELYGFLLNNIFQEKDYHNILSKLNCYDISKWLLDAEFIDEYMELDSEIMADLEYCVKSRAVSKNDFFDKMYFAYVNGAWPCGWEGEFPNGKMVVFVPSKS